MTQRRQAQHSTGAWHRESGVTLAELMAVLAVGAVVLAGGVIAFNTALTRAEGGNIASGMQGFMVDIATYLSSYHQESFAGATEANLQANNDDFSKIRDAGAWGAPGGGVLYNAAIPAAEYDGNGDGDFSDAGEFQGPNPNVQRLVTMPSLRFYDSNDADDLNEWSIQLSPERSLDVSFQILPGTNAADLTEVGDGQFCQAPADTGRPDTAIAFEIIMEDIDVCNVVATRIQAFDTVLQAWCLDDDTDPVWRFAATTGNSQGEATLGICFAVQS